jgi:hypothetical protein
MSEVASGSFQVSLSAFQVWQRCEQKYYYGYVRKLRPRDQFLAPTLGRILHFYLESYYSNLRELNTEDSHIAAQLKTSEQFIPDIRSYANASYLGGAEELAKELLALPALAGRITDRYFVARGRFDAERYIILRVEQFLNLKLTDGIHSTGVVDLVTRDKGTGRLSLWEHKSTQNVPPDSVRLRDFQTLLYAVKLRWLTGEVIDSVIWNYLRTKEPSVPEVLKSGGLTKRKDIDTTWETYAEAIRSVGGNPDSPQYTEIYHRLAPREMTIFFPRYEQVLMMEESSLMGDYILEAERMRRARMDWSKGVSRPIRTIERSCDGCEFLKLCLAALTGGDEEDVIRLRYTNGRSD